MKAGASTKNEMETRLKSISESYRNLVAIWRACPHRVES